MNLGAVLFAPAEMSASTGPVGHRAARCSRCIRAALLVATALGSLSACGSKVTANGSDGGAGAQGPTGGASPVSVTCEEVCAKATKTTCQSSEIPFDPCQTECERVLAAAEGCAEQTDAFLTCILDEGACTSSAALCLPELKSWTECSGVLCGGCTNGGGSGWSSSSCHCLGVPERTSTCSFSDDNCKCTLWGEPWLETGAEGECDWPYED